MASFTLAHTPPSSASPAAMRPVYANMFFPSPVLPMSANLQAAPPQPATDALTGVLRTATAIEAPQAQRPARFIDYSPSSTTSGTVHGRRMGPGSEAHKAATSPTRKAFGPQARHDVPAHTALPREGAKQHQQHMLRQLSWSPEPLTDSHESSDDTVSSGGSKEVTVCHVCGKEYKHRSCLSKHLWEHDAVWNITKRLCISKHQQVQLLEAAKALVHMADSPCKTF